MEISVGFADKEEDYYRSNGFTIDNSEVGKVYIPEEGVEITEHIGIRYERHPWIEQFEVDGVQPLAAKRHGYGSKDFPAFVKSLSTIYAPAYELFGECGIAEIYFAKATDDFIRNYSDEAHIKMLRKYFGFVENLWREGNKEIYDVAMGTVIPMLRKDQSIWKLFCDCITVEFTDYIKGAIHG